MSALPPPLPPAIEPKKGLPAVAWVVIVGVAVIAVLTVIGVLAVAGFAGGQTAINKAKKVTALATATQLENAFRQFYGEYSSLPDPGSPKHSHDLVVNTAEPDGQVLLSMLMGNESGTAIQNSKNLQFFNGRPGKGGKNGLITLSSGLSELRDPWGNPYYVVIDYDGDESLQAPANSGDTAVVHGHRVLVYSLGQDGKGGAAAIRTW